MYLDSAYIAKFYLNEVDSDAVRQAVKAAGRLVSSAYCLAEVICAIHRITREGRMSTVECQQMTRWFLEDVDAGFWELTSVTEALLRRVNLVVSAAPASLFVRAGDAVHLVTAQDLGEQEVWTNDRHLLAAAPYFGLAGRSV